MKKIIMICALMFSVATFVRAQDAPVAPAAPKVYTPEDLAKRSTKQLAGILNFTEDQKTKVNALYLDQNTQTNTINEDASIEKNAKKVQIMKLRADVDAKIVALLTEEQKAAYQKWKDERKAAKEAAAAKPSM